MRLRSVTIDLDGTLLDTIGDLAAACDAMLLELGRQPLGVARVRCLVGRGMAVLVERCLQETGREPGRSPDAAQLARGIESFQRQYAAVNGRAALIYPGVIDGLRALQAQGLALGVVTNKPAAFTAPLLARTGLASYFRLAVSGDTTAQKKPHPEPILHACRLLGTEPAENLHIGDSPHDIAAARAAGCPVYCVPYGYTEGKPVDSADCDALVSDLVDAACRVAKYNELLTHPSS